MNRYDEMDDLALQVRMDYGFLDKRLDIFQLAEKLNIHIVKYSQLTSEQREIVENQCSIKDALTIFDCNTVLPSCFLFYNDNQNSTRIRFSIAHEIKHVLRNERHPSNDDEMMADHFARVLLAPPCVIIYEDYDVDMAIASDFDISCESAGHALNSAINRRKSSRFKLSKIEEEFIELYKNNKHK